MTTHHTSGAADLPEALRHSLWLALQHTVNRYLLSCSHGRWDGHEKATRHIELCNHYVATFKGGTLEDAMTDHEAAWKAVHDGTQALTDNMDEVIGFPVDSRPDYESLAPLFFAEFHRLALIALAAGQAVAPAVPPKPPPVSLYREACATGERCLHGCHKTEPCYSAARPAPPAMDGDTVTKERLKQILGTPEGVHLNMLNGKIATITMDQCAHLHGEEMQRKWTAMDGGEDAAQEREDVMPCYWVMMRECESKADCDNDPVLRHQVEGFYRLWNRVQGQSHSPIWVERATRAAQKED